MLLSLLSVAHADCATDDSYEDNDDGSTAAALTAGSFSGLQVCNADEDWFSIQGTEGERLIVTALFSHALGDVDIYLYAADDTENSVMSSLSSTDNEEMQYVVETAGSYLIRVKYFTSDENSNQYDLSIASEIILPCPEDSYSTNIDIATAAQLSLGAHSLVACHTEYFSVELSAGQWFYADATFSATDGDLDLKIMDLAEGTMDSSASITDNESAAFFVEEAATYLIEAKLYSDKGDYGLLYDLNLYLSDEEPVEDTNNGWDTGIGGEPAGEPSEEPAGEPSEEPAGEPSEEAEETEEDSSDDLVIDNGNEEVKISCNKIGFLDSFSPLLLLGFILGISRRFK